MKIRLKMLIPGETPVWFRKAWKGTKISMDLSSQPEDGTTYTVSTPEAIAGLREQSPGAAYLWSCCFAGVTGPTMSFPRSICEVIPDDAAPEQKEVEPYFRGKELPPYFRGVGINKF